MGKLFFFSLAKLNINKQISKYEMGLPSYDSGFKRRRIKAYLVLRLALLFEVWKQQWLIVSEVVLVNCLRKVVIKWSKVSENRNVISD